jgi:hypothetical protein
MPGTVFHTSMFCPVCKFPQTLIKFKSKQILEFSLSTYSNKAYLLKSKLKLNLLKKETIFSLT